MNRNWSSFREFENSLAASQTVDYQKNLIIFEALFLEAKSIGVFPLKNPLEGIEVDINLARVLNHVPRASKKASPSS